MREKVRKLSMRRERRVFSRAMRARYSR